MFAIAIDMIDGVARQLLGEDHSFQITNLSLRNEAGDTLAYFVPTVGWVEQANPHGGVYTDIVITDIPLEDW